MTTKRLRGKAKAHGVKEPEKDVSEGRSVQLHSILLKAEEQGAGQCQWIWHRETFIIQQEHS